jgi:hypothetical protein
LVIFVISISSGGSSADCDGLDLTDTRQIFDSIDHQMLHWDHSLGKRWRRGCGGTESDFQGARVKGRANARKRPARLVGIRRSAEQSCSGTA